MWRTLATICGRGTMRVLETDDNQLRLTVTTNSSVHVLERADLTDNPEQNVEIRRGLIMRMMDEALAEVSSEVTYG